MTEEIKPKRKRATRDRTKYSAADLFAIKQNPRLNIIEIDGSKVLECNKRSIATKTGKLYTPKELDTLSYCLGIEEEQVFFDQLEDGGPLPERYTWNVRNNVVNNPLGYSSFTKYRKKTKRLTLKESIAKYNGGRGIPFIVKELTALANGTSKTKSPSVALAANKLLLEAYYREELNKKEVQTVDVNVKYDIMQLITNARKNKQIKNITHANDDDDIIEAQIQ